MPISNFFNRTGGLLGLIFMMGVLFCYGQTGNSQLQAKGKVFDQNHAAIAGAKVTVTAKTGGAVFTTITDQGGEFSVDVQPGEYVIRVEAKGFSEVSQIVKIKENNADALELTLPVEGAKATVTVLDTSNYRVETIGSATRTSIPLRDVPQAITVVTKEQIKDQMMTSIADVVRYAPGIASHQGENNRDQVIIRGQSTSADFFRDGQRDDVQYYRDIYNVERVETLKGPNAMVFGRGGGGGVINRVTKEANFSPSRELVVQGGSYSDIRIAGDINQPINKEAAFRLNSVFENSDSFRKSVGLQRFGINPTFTFRPAAKTTFRIGYEFARDRRTADRGITSFQGKPADVPIDTFYGNPDDSHVRSDVNLVSGLFEQQITSKLVLRNRTLYGDYNRKYQNYVPGAVNTAKTLVTLTAYNNATKRKNIFNQTDLVYEVSTGKVKHTLLGGFELGNQLTDNFRNTGFFNNTATSIQVDYNNPTITTPTTFRQSATDADNHLNTNLAAAYLQDQIRASRYVQFIVGARFDYFDLKYHNNRDGSNLRRVDDLVSPRVGIVVKPIEAVSIYGNYSVSYLPSSGDQFSSLTTVTQQVKPEKFSNYEVGVKWDIRRNLTMSSAAYRLDRTNTRATDPLNPAAIIQTGSQQTDGFEIGLNGNVTPKWRVAGGYAYQDAKITSATTSAPLGAQVAQVPHNTFSLWNNYQFLPKLGAGLGLIQRSDMFAAIVVTGATPVILPGYLRADGAIYYSISEHWRFQANVENLFNKRYFTNADSVTNISPGSPRAIRVGLVARF
jgi:catecholate siderophore receptor